MGKTSTKPYSDAMAKNCINYLILTVMLGFVTGCSTNDNADLHARINSIKAQPSGKIPPLPVFPPYESFMYAAKDKLDPFKGFSSEQADNMLLDVPDNSPLGNRNLEALEQYPLDTLKFVGQLTKDGDNWAIITSPDHVVHRVKVGNHLGNNFGEITQIMEDKILIEETISDDRGGWLKREAALSLME